MGDYYYAKIKFGGKISKAKLDELFDQLKEHSLVEEKADMVEKIMNKDFSFDSAEAKYGMFEELENWCVANKIAYQRQTGGFYDQLPFIETYIPGVTDTSTEQVTDIITDDSGEPLISLDALQNHRDDKKTLQQVIEHLAGGKPDLPPLDFTGCDT